MRRQFWRASQRAVDGGIWAVLAPAFPFLVLAYGLMNFSDFCERKANAQ